MQTQTEMGSWGRARTRHYEVEHDIIVGPGNMGQCGSLQHNKDLCILRHRVEAFQQRKHLCLALRCRRESA